jgi:PPP family 3-phenylpropionic acid transporter
MSSDTPSVDGNLRPADLSGAGKPRLFEVRMALLYMAVIVPNGIMTPFLPSWLRESGFLPTEIGVLLALPLLARVVAGPTISAFADRAPDRVPILIGLAILSTLAAAGFLPKPTYAFILFVSIAYALFWGPLTPLTDSLALSGVRRYRSDYAKMRIWGSVAYLAINIVAGWVIGRAGAGAFPWLLIAACSSIIFTAVLIAPRIGRPRRPSLQPVEALPRAAPIFRSRYFVLFLCASALFQSSHAVLYAFATIYWQSIGIGGTAIGFLWSFSVMAEVALFALSGVLFRQMSTTHVMVLSGVLAVIRWALYPFAWGLGLGLPGFFFLQGLHAFSYSAGFLATQRMLSERVPEDRIGAAQGVAYFGANMLLAVFTFVSGPLYTAFGVLSFLSMAVIAAIGLALSLICVPLAPKDGLRRKDERTIIAEAG